MWLNKIDGALREFHGALWAAIDELAANNGLTACGLARITGLTLTAFNPSKRYASRTGRPRFPTFETVDRMLHATNTTWPEFIEMVMAKMP